MVVVVLAGFYHAVVRGSDGGDSCYVRDGVFLVGCQWLPRASCGCQGPKNALNPLMVI